MSTNEPETISMPKIAQNIFLKHIATRKNSRIFSEFKELLDLTIQEMEKCYITEYSQYEDKLKILMSDVYNCIFRIHGYLEMFNTREENQSNKFLIQDCISIIGPVARFTTSYYEVKNKIKMTEIHNIAKLSKIKRNAPELLNVEASIESLHESNREQLVALLNIITNDYLLNIYKIKATINKLN
jgi:hypothetical protein